MINTRYYIYLMIAIFLALGLGMMIGITLENKNIIENQQTLMINQIEERITYYKAETEALKDNINAIQIENEQLHRVSNKLFDEAIVNQLANINIALISFDGKLDNTYIAMLLEHCGALIQSNIVFSVNDMSDLFKSATNKTMTSDYDELMGLVIEDITYSLNFGVTTPLVEEMQDLGILENDLGFGTPVDYVIVIGGGRTTSFYDALLIENIIKSDIGIVVVESAGINESAMEDYMSFGVTTIDNIDSLYGRLSLISILNPVFINKESVINDYEQNKD